MKIISYWLAFFSTALISFGSQTASAQNAKTLVISDIDDTIRPTHILNLPDAALVSLFTQDQFLGMSMLYKLIEKQIPNTTIYYVTNAQVWHGLNVFTGLYLQKNNFPQNQNLSLRPDFSVAEGANKKVPRITQLIDSLKPDRLILIGDNGEYDATVYDRIHDMYPNLPMQVYIHQPYSARSQSQPGKKLADGQNGYVTSIDIALDLYRKQWIQANGLIWLSNQIIPKILSQNFVGETGDTAFYAWMDCRDFQIDDRASLALPQKTQSLLQQYLSKLKQRCMMPAIAN